MVKRSNKEIEEAAEELMRLNGDEEVRRRAAMYEIIELNARSARNYMLKKGFEEGMEKRHRKTERKNGIKKRSRKGKKGRKSSNSQKNERRWNKNRDH